MMNKTDLIPKKARIEISKPSKKLIVVYKKEEPITDLPDESTEPPTPKEFPVNKWSIPPQQQGYLRINDNDFL